MIKQLAAAFAPWDIYSARILAAHCSYYDMPECQFWAQYGGNPNALAAVISLVDGFAVLAAKKEADGEELISFLKMQPWSRLQCSVEIASKLPFPLEWRSMLVRFVGPEKELPNADIRFANEPGGPPPKACRLYGDPGEVYDILVLCGLGVKNRNDWMADLALRWRRGTAQTWVLDGACTGSAVAITPKHIYVGALGTLPEHRGRGLARQMISHICGHYAGRAIWLSCREELRGFYESVGFARAGDMITLQKENSR